MLSSRGSSERDPALRNKNFKSAGSQIAWNVSIDLWSLSALTLFWVVVGGTSIARRILWQGLKNCHVSTEQLWGAKIRSMKTFLLQSSLFVSEPHRGLNRIAYRKFIPWKPIHFFFCFSRQWFFFPARKILLCRSQKNINAVATILHTYSITVVLIHLLTLLR